MTKWLPASDDSPTRPDVFVLRHITWTEIHTILLGVGFGLLVAWGIVLGQQGAVFGVAVLVAQLILGEGQQRSKKSSCEHRIGVHDVRQEPWYFVTATVVIVGASLGAAAVVGVML